MNKSDLLNLVSQMSEEEIAQMSEEDKAQLGKLFQPKNRESILGNSHNKSIIKNEDNTEKVNPQNVKDQMTAGQKRIAAAANDRTITQYEPLVLFVGPASCGKSMVLMSLVDYLRGLGGAGYTISANENYIMNDEKYREKCNMFMKALEDNTNNVRKVPLDKTVDEVLVDVMQNNIRKCSMLEAPGEDFFDIGNPGKKYKEYIKNIIQREDRCPIYYVLLLDLHTKNNNFNDPKDNVRIAYENRLIEIIKDGFNKKLGDRVILLYNKFDLHEKGITDNDAMKKLFKVYYQKIKEENTLYKTVLGTKLYPYFEELPYISGKYEINYNDEGEEVETYITTGKVIATVTNLWQKLK